MTSTQRTSEKDRGQAVKDFFARRQDDLLGMMYYLTGSLRDAREALQQSYNTCWHHRHAAPRDGTLPLWVFGTALGIARKTRAASDERQREQSGNGDTSAEIPTLKHARLNALHVLVFQLSTEQREVLLLRQNGQLSYDQIAGLVSAPTAEVKQRMAEALEQMQGVI